MTLFCFFWHRFRGHGADSPCLPSLDTFPCHTGEDGSLHTHTGCWGSNSLPPATMFKITGHCLHCYTGLAGSRTVLSELRTQLPTVQCTSVQCTGVQCSLLLVYSGHLVTARCTGMRSPHYGFVCKHRQGLLCMFNYRRIGRKN